MPSSFSIPNAAATALCCFALLFFLGPHGTAPAYGQGARVFTVVDSLVGGVGGVAVDRLGDIYVADFGETVWKIKPDGRVIRFAKGLYGASGNAVDAHGNLYQSNFSGHYISRIDRFGNHEIAFEDGLAGPVGIAIDPDGNLFVCNCQGNTISKAAVDGTVSLFADGDLFNCPNGITFDPDGNLYVVNYSDEKMLKITPDATVTHFASLPGGGNGHVTFARGNLYATSFQGHRIYRVSLAGEVELIAGTGARGEVDGPGTEAQFSWPNGIAAGPTGDRLYVNDFINRFPPTIDRPPVRLSSVRMVKLPSLADMMAQALREEGIETMVAVYREYKANPATAGVYSEVEMNVLGYGLMGAGQMDAAIEVFRLNVEAYPNSFNVYDSLGEAYRKAGRREQAITFYEKSLALNPSNENGRKALEELRQQ
jgi:sugar lactone lactonase YvrE